MERAPWLLGMDGKSGVWLPSKTVAEKVETEAAPHRSSTVQRRRYPTFGACLAAGLKGAAQGAAAIAMLLMIVLAITTADRLTSRALSALGLPPHLHGHPLHGHHDNAPEVAFEPRVEFVP